MAEKAGCDLGIADAGTFESQNLFDSLGFKTVKVLHNKDFVDSDGKELITDSGITTCAKLMLISFNSQPKA